MAKSGFKVVIIESELKDGGQRVEDIQYFKYIEKADAYVTVYNSSNNATVVPGWYMYAEEAVFVRDIPDNVVFEDELDG